MTPNTPEQSNLGRASTYSSQYDASLLFPIPRAPKRQEIGIAGDPLFVGADLWTAFELSWLNAKGKPVVVIGHFVFDASSPNIIESKSFKLYLNSFNNTHFACVDDVINTLKADLSRAAWAGSSRTGSVGVKLLLPYEFSKEKVASLKGIDLDRLDISCDTYHPNPNYLTVSDEPAIITETLCSNLLKSNCLITGQPDWGSIQISYTGRVIDQEGLLRYLISFRNHNEFHEQCVERIYIDMWNQCKPTKLLVYARYTRRGGLDICPIRSSHPIVLPNNDRLARQ